MMDWESEGIKSTLQTMQGAFSHDLEEVQILSDRIYVNNQLNTLLGLKFNDIQEVYTAYSQMTFFDNYLHVYPQVQNIRIYTENPDLLDNSFIIKTDKKILNSKWYVDAINTKGQSFWLYKLDSVSQKKYFCLIRSLWSSEGKFLGVLCMNINPEIFSKLLKSPTYDSLIFLDSEMFLSSFDNLSQEEILMFRSMVNDSILNLKTIQRKRFRNQSYGISESRFKAPGNAAVRLVIFNVFPMANLYHHFASVILFSVVTLTVFGALAMTVFFLFATYLKRRFGRIKNEIVQIVDNNFEIAPSIGGHDEFAQIYNTIYQMSNDIKQLIKEVYQQNLEKEQLTSRQNEIRFKMLATQINPHFLFNTIETIRMKAIASGEKEIASMLRMLAALLRYNLSVKGTPVPLEKELEAVDNYLKIQQMRFGSRVSYDLLVTGEKENVMVLPLLIQPLVENSFSHGLEDRLSGGMIYIIINILSISEQEKYMDIIVKDNGCGIEEEKLAQLQEKLDSGKNDEHSMSIGIENVNSRIKLFYGNEYGMKIESKVGEGTSVTLHFALK
ncbi:MAG: sensor histidine kinase [Treponema sp.]|nr:sensor histidine kinase [Treponema sp.]